MEDYREIDFQTWHRADLFNHYTMVWPSCLMTFNVTVDVTETVKFVKSKGEKVAPAFYFLAAKALNEQENHRMGFLDGKIVCWNNICPLYPVMNEYKNICFHHTAWNEKYSRYYEDYLKEAEENANCLKAVCGETPRNFVMMSILPFMDFESASFANKNPKYYLAPAVFMGKFTEKEGRITMPLSFTFNHAVSDGYHSQLFFESFQDKLNNPEEWLEG